MIRVEDDDAPLVRALKAGLKGVEEKLVPGCTMELKGGLQEIG